MDYVRLNSGFTCRRTGVLWIYRTRQDTLILFCNRRRQRPLMRCQRILCTPAEGSTDSALRNTLSAVPIPRKKMRGLFNVQSHQKSAFLTMLGNLEVREDAPQLSRVIHQ